MPNLEYESDMWHLWTVHVAPASKTAGCLFPCMLDLDRDVHFNYGGIGLLNGRWQHCITTVNISLYTWVYKCHIHECIWQNKGEWPKWAAVWLYTECYMNIYKWIDTVGNLAKYITNICKISEWVKVNKLSLNVKKLNSWFFTHLKSEWLHFLSTLVEWIWTE